MLARIRILLFEGSRKLIPADTKVLVSLRPQFKIEPMRSRWEVGNNFNYDVEVPDDGTGYAVLVSAKGYEDAGIAPLKLKKKEQKVHLMLVKKDARYQFAQAHWDSLPKKSSLRRFLRASETDDERAGARYRLLLETQPDAFATLHNVAAALAAIRLPCGNGLRTAFSYLHAIDWEDVRRDRFFGFASEVLLKDLRAAAGKGSFEEEPLAGIFHPGATVSYKQTTFAEANLQISFHGTHRLPGHADPLTRVELDMDYYRDGFAHALLEVIPNTLSFGQRKTDPRQIYVMRWMAGKMEGQEFEPLYTIA